MGQLLEQGAERRKKRAERREKREESREQRAESREQRAESREQRAESREQRDTKAIRFSATTHYKVAEMTTQQTCAVNSQKRFQKSTLS